jgi:hypothetical protein
MQKSVTIAFETLIYYEQTKLPSSKFPQLVEIANDHDEVSMFGDYLYFFL